MISGPYITDKEARARAFRSNLLAAIGGVFLLSLPVILVGLGIVKG